MAVVARASLLSPTILSSNFKNSLSSPLLAISNTRRRYVHVNASVSDLNSTSSSPILNSESKIDRWKPMCLYYTQGKCVKMDDPAHLETFNHDCLKGLHIDGVEVKRVRSQNFDYLLVLDLEGKVEILEFPVVMINARTMEYVDFFHRTLPL